MFLNVPFHWISAVLSGLSDEHKRLRPLCLKSHARSSAVGRIPVKWDYRNTPFLRLAWNTYTAAAATERAGESRAGGTKEGVRRKGRYDGSGKGGEGR